MTDPLTNSLDWLRSQEKAMIEQLIEWSEINSDSRDLGGLNRMAERLVRDWDAQGIGLARTSLPEIEEIDADGEPYRWETGPLLSANRRGEQRRLVLLVIHYDTVHPAGSRFSQCERIDASRLRGPGVADAKGGLLVMLWALATIERFDLASNIGWTAILNPDEELGSPASESLLTEQAGVHDFGLVFEPALPDGSLVGDRKGSGNFVLVVRGRSAHAGREPELGRNAIVRLAQIISEIDSMNDYDSGLVANVGKIEGGGPLNQVPDLAIARINIRVVNQVQMSAAESKLREIVVRADNADGYRATLHGGFHAPPKTIDDRGHRLQQAISDAQPSDQPPIRWRPTGGACDGSKLAARGLVNVDTLGPIGGNLHSDEEWVDTSSLVLKVETILRLIAGYSRGDWVL